MAAAGALGIGFVPWPVTVPLNGILLQWSGASGWYASVRKVRWTPFQSVRAAEVRLSSPRGSLLHLVGLSARLKGARFLVGRPTFLLTVSEIRLDPGSFGIRDRLALELLSTGPVVTQGRAELLGGWGGLILKDLMLEGPLLRVMAQGRLVPRQKMDWRMEGFLAGRLVESLRLVGEGNVQPWEPFSVRWVGTGPYLEGSMTLGARSFSWKITGDKTS